VTTASAAARSFVWTGRHVAILVVLCVGHVLETVDLTITNVALPAIRTGVGFDAAGLSWVVNGYAVAFAGFLLLGSRVGHVYGPRRVLTAGLGLFCAASVVAALATAPWVMIAGRGLQGAAAAFIAPMTLSLLAAVFPAGRPRDTAIGVWAVITTASGSIAMLAGGLLTEGPGWRWVFGVNVPVALVVLVVGWRLLPVDARRDRSKHIDVIGAATATAGVGLLVAALVGTAGRGATSGPTLALLAAAAVALGYAVVHETGLTSQPLLPRALLASRSAMRANAAQALSGGAIIVMFTMVTLYQQNVLGFTPWQTALAYLPHTAVLVIAARLAPPLIARLGTATTTAVGAVLGAAGLALLTSVPAGGRFVADLLLPSLLLGVAIPLTLIPNTTAALADLPAELHAAAAGAVTIARVLGGTLALALASAVAARRSDARIAGGGSPAEALTAGYVLAFGLAAGLFVAAAAVALTSRGRRWL
jgi:MFS family permease